MADVLAVRDEYKAQSWAMLIQVCKTSGLTNKESCERCGVSGKCFYYWQRKFHEQLVDATAPQVVPLDSLTVSKDLLQFQYCGAKLKFPADVDMVVVAAILCSLQLI